MLTPTLTDHFLEKSSIVAAAAVIPVEAKNEDTHVSRAIHHYAPRSSSTGSKGKNPKNLRSSAAIRSAQFFLLLLCRKTRKSVNRKPVSCAKYYKILTAKKKKGTMVCVQGN